METFHEAARDTPLDAALSRRGFLRRASRAAAGAAAAMALAPPVLEAAPADSPRAKETNVVPPTTPAFPLRPGANGRYLVDQNNVPFLIHGDTGWMWSGGLFGLPREQISRYLDDRAAKGFTTIQFLLMCTDLRNGTTADPFGHYPFTARLPAPNDAYWDFAARDQAYFDHVRWIVGQCQSRGLLAAVCSSWLGYDPGGLMWAPHVVANGPSKCLGFGRYLGEQFSEGRNLLWVHGGDQIPDATRAACQHRVMEGIKQVAPAHLHTAHWRRPPQPDLSRSIAPFTNVDVEMVYSASLTYYGCLRNWNNVLGLPAIPAYMGESYYERQARFKPPGEWPAYACRRQAYWALLSGAGHVYGDEHPKRVTDDELNLPGTLDMARVKALFASIPWYDLVPDDAAAGYQVFVNDTGQRGTPGTDSARAHLNDDYVAAACAWRAGKVTLGLAYLPPTGTAPRTLRVDVSKFSAATVARWYNPHTGAWTSIGSFANSGMQDFATPGDNGSGTNDWVLFLAAA